MTNLETRLIAALANLLAAATTYDDGILCVSDIEEVAIEARAILFEVQEREARQ